MADVDGAAGGAMQDRISRLLDGLDLASGCGLEIGPLATPILRRPQHRVLYLDHVPTEQLRRTYEADPAVRVDAIVPVDVVWADASLRDAVGAEIRFDHVVASHVVEHVPDLVTWLAEIGTVLRPDGALRLIVPDRRFTMDIARRETVLADVLAAHLEKRTRPTPRDVIDFYGNYRIVERDAAWMGVEPPGDGAALSEIGTAMTQARSALAGAYCDAHCWVFTPGSFVRLMGNLAAIGECGYLCARIVDTVPGEIDFFVHLQRSGDAERIRDSWERARQEVARSRSAGPGLQQDEPDALRAAMKRLEAAAGGRVRELERDLEATRLTVDHLRSVRGAFGSLRQALARRVRQAGRRVVSGG